MKNRIHSMMTPLKLALVLLAFFSTVEARRNASGVCESMDIHSSNIQEIILILPHNQDFSNKTFNVIFYFILMLYMFLGISVTSNCFMCSIEVIVSKTKKVVITKFEDGINITEEKQTKVWNETIASLTLMALGSSAPEILLSIIETVGNDFCSGSLGPGTIVGSAAYNLMIITAVCIVSVPNDGIKRIKEYKVFVTTSIFAVIAYVWMVVILQVISQGVVEIWEACLTLLFFPVMLAVSYWAELDFCTRGRKVKRDSIISSINDPRLPELTSVDAAQSLFRFFDARDDLVDESGAINIETVKSLYHDLERIAILTDEEIATVLATRLIQSRGHSILWYKIRTMPGLLAGEKTRPALTEKLKEVMEVLNDMKNTETGKPGNLRPLVISAETYKNKAVLEFSASCMAVPATVGSCSVVVRRVGREDFTVNARVDTYDGTAREHDPFVPVSQPLVFEPYMTELKVTINVIGDGKKKHERDRSFFLKLTLTKDTDKTKVALGAMSVMEVVVMDIDKPGEITFAHKGQVIKDTAAFADIQVERVNGADGKLSAKWVTVPGPKCTRVVETEGTLRFEHGEMKKVLEIPLSPGKGTSAEDEQFDVKFVEIVEGGGKLATIQHTTVAISADTDFKLKITRIVGMAEEKSECAVKKQTYKEQIQSAFIVNGGVEEAKLATKTDKILHYFSVPWKAVLCFLPTPYTMGGWPCFVCTLIVIGFLTAVVGDMATIFGYSLGLDPVTTAITFVALGTSLPDTFASRIAARNDKTADAAIGNITGSNSVNVFLGLGLPWTLASLYTKINYPDQELTVNALSLAFVVTIYTLVSLFAQFILWLRRHSISFGYAELGGPLGTKWLTSSFLIVGWFFYVSFSTMLTQNFNGMQKLAHALAKFLKVS